MRRYFVGPVWEADPEKLPLPREDLHQTPDGFWVPNPTRTLGFDALAWGVTNLLQPDGPDSGGPFIPTGEQQRFILWWYAVDATGRFLYPSGMMMRMKGAGKDPLGAFLCLVELLGPCRFAGWREDGTPVVVPHPDPWVAVAAVSQEQTNNTMRLLPSMVSDALREKHGIEAHKEIWHTTTGTLQAFASSYRALEGKRLTFTLCNETHHWVPSNQGHDIMKTIEDNSVKSRDGASRTLAITNAHVPGEDSVAERMWDGYHDWLSGRLMGDRPPFLVDALQAPPETDLADDESLRRGILAARGDAVWLDVDRIVARVRDPRNPPERSRRMYLNQVVAAEDAWVTAYEYDACTAPHKTVSRDDEIVMFFDGSKSDDSTALVGCRVSDGHVFVIAAWDRPGGAAGVDWEVDKDAVDHAVTKAIEERNVVAFWGDVLHFEGLHDRWSALVGPRAVLWAQEGKYRHATAWDMRGKEKEFTLACERMAADIRAAYQDRQAGKSVDELEFTHDGDPALRAHVLNVRRRPNRWGVGIGKEHRMSARKIDRAVCMVGARMLRRRVIESGRLGKRYEPADLIVF